MKSKIRLTESDLHRMVRNAVSKVLREDVDASNDIQGLSDSDKRIYDACLKILSMTNDYDTLYDVLNDVQPEGLSFFEAEEVCQILDAFYWGSDVIYDDGRGGQNSMVNKKVLNLLKQNEGDY